MSTKKRRAWRTVNIPEALAKIIEEVIKSGKGGYRNVPDFVTDAVRKRLRELDFLA